MTESWFKKVIAFFSNRTVVFIIFVFFLFYSMLSRIFQLQVVEGEEFARRLNVTSVERVRLKAPRGNIYDKFGRPLAVNKSAYSVKIDPSVELKNEEMNEVISNLIDIFKRESIEWVDEFPISKEKPYIFLFNDNEKRKERWLDDMTLPLTVKIESEETQEETQEETRPITAEDAFYKLREKFALAEYLSDDEAREIIGLRSMVFMKRYTQINPITVAYDVKENVIVQIEEKPEVYKGVFIDLEALREYPEKGYAAHIVGRTGKISREEFEENQDAYMNTDIVGKTGLEKSFEEDFRGRDGERLVEVNKAGRPVSNSEFTEETPPVPGNKLFTTLDMDLQRKSYHILEEQLKIVLINKLMGVSDKEEPITLKELFQSLVKNYNLPLKEVMESEEGEYGYKIKEYVITNYPEWTIAEVVTKENRQDIIEVINDGIEKGRITSADMLLTLNRLGVITGDNLAGNITSGRLTSLQIVIEKIKEGELTPQMLNLDPSTGSLVVENVKTGDVLAAVSYPTFDPNELVNNMNEAYYNRLNDDLTHPMNNRPFMEPRAPGSTFKMISAIAGLESGSITENTRYYDQVTFKKAGLPYSSCWSSVSHGNVNIIEALETSCNYFFSEELYQMGNSKDGNMLVGINILDKYMLDFGLNERSGVEIGEFRDTLPKDLLAISSPEYMEYVEKSRDPNAPGSQYKWKDGETIRTSYGQSYNNYTAANMVKYVSTLATEGVRYKLHLMDRTETYKGDLLEKYDVVPETTVEISPENLDIVYKGMLAVTEGRRGTARNVFRDFPIRVAGKTGTAQQSATRNDHTSFGAFAPFEDPQIAIYVAIPYGDTKTTAAPSSEVAKNIIAEYFKLESEAELPPPVNDLSF